MQAAGAIMAVLGVGLWLWCATLFAVVGRGTPLPFDPPRRLVVRGPYRFVRNPMAAGFGLVLAAAALYFESVAWAVVAGLFFLAVHLFVVLYEEPTLRKTFGDEYREYCAAVRRWLPTWKPYSP